jgi:hypothetical protein
MPKDESNSDKEMHKLSQAFDRAHTSITRTGQAFGELAKSSQEWNIISRILSGTGMWRLQNQIRAVGNIINVYHKRQENAMKSTLEAVEANENLAKSFADVEKALKMSDADIAKTPLAMMFTRAGRDGIKEYKDMWTEAGKQLGKAETGLAKALTPSNTSMFLAGGFFKGDDEDSGVGQYMKRGFNKSRTVRASKAVGRWGARAYRGMRNIGIAPETLAMEKSIGTRFKAVRGDIRTRGKRAGQSFLKKMNKIGGKISQFFIVGAGFLLKASFYFLAIITGIALLVLVLKKLKLKKRFKAFEKKFGYFAELFGEVKDILTAVYDIFKAAFAGDEGAMWQGIKDLVMAWLGMLETIIKILLQSLWQIFKTLPSLIWQGLKGLGKAIWPFANGGVVNGGLQLVGERGPELVRLPSGSRVHSNAESRRMAGGTINVHVNGRVGASDSEIRDIANKVAREINLSMNRSAHTTGTL